jgi:hypothetical protein
MDAYKLLRGTALFLATALLMAVPGRAQFQLVVSSTTVNLNDNQARSIQVTAPGTTALAYTVSSVPFWLSTFSANNFKTPDTLYFQIANTNCGTCTATISLVPVTPAGIEAPIFLTAITVTYAPGGTGGGGTIAANPSSLNFNAASGQSATSQNVSLSTTSGSTIGFTAVSDQPWLVISASSFSVTSANPATLTVSASALSLASGIYIGHLTIVPSAGAPTVLTVTFNVTASGGTGTGALTVSPTALTFTASPGGAPQSQNVMVTAPASASVDLDATSFNGPFFSVVSPFCNATPNPAFSCTFTGNQGFTVVVNPANLTVAGTYNGSLTFQTGSTTVTVYLSLQLTAPVTTLTVSPPALAFTAAAGSAAQTQSLTVSVPGSALVQAIVTSFNGNFFSVSSSNCNANPSTNPTCSFNGSQTLYVTVNPANLTTAGAYNGAIMLQSGGATVNVPLSLTLSGTGTGGGPIAIAAPAALAFFYQVNSSAVVPQQVITVGAAGTYTAAASVSSAQQWLIANAVGSTGPGYVVVSVSPQGLAPGTYTGVVTINSANGTTTIPVVLTVTTGAVVEASPGNFNFSYQAGSAPAQTGITLFASDNSAMPVTATSSTPWIAVGPLTSSTTPAFFPLTINPSGLCNGLNAGSVTISAPNAANNGFAIPVVALVSGSTATTGCTNSGGAPLVLGPPALLFSAPANGIIPPPQNLVVTAPSPNSGYTVNASVQGGVPNWLTVQPSGLLFGSQSLLVFANQAGLLAGTYSGTISFNTNGNVQTVPVTLIVSPSTGGSSLIANPSILSFTADSGKSAGSQIVTLSTTSTTPITIIGVGTDSPNFLSAAVTGGSFSVSSGSPATLTVSATAARLPTGTVSGHITVTASNGAIATITVTINVGSGSVTGTIIANPPNLVFAAPAGQAVPGPVQAVTLTTANSTAVSILSIVPDVNWLSTGLSSLTVSSISPATLTVSASAANLATGFYVGHLTINPSVGTFTIIAVTFLVPPGSGNGTITASQTSFQFAYPGTLSALVTIGTSNPTVPNFNVTVASQPNWLRFSNSSVPAGAYTGVPFGVYPISVDPAVAAGLTAGTYNGTITLINPLSPADTTIINVTLTVGGGINLAVGKTATQSSTLPGYPTAVAGAAIDGIADGNFFDGSVTATNLDPNPWWQVDLGASSTINSIVVWNRTDCCGTRLSDYWVFVSDTPFLATDTPATLQFRAGTFGRHQTTAPNPSMAIPAGTQGRYVRVQLTSAGYLSLAEVQVFGSGGLPIANLAQGKAATQSSTLPGYPTAGASAAVDGNPDGNFQDGSVTATNLDPNPWWQVDLGTSAAIGSIVVWNRTDCCGTRLSDYWVFVSNTPFLPTDTPATLQSRAGTFSSHQTNAPNPSTLIAPVGLGRYVRIQLTSSNYLSLAEVQVFGVPAPSSTNLAQGKAATQSSTLPGYPTAAASAAVDGNPDGNFFDGSVTATNLDPNPWWQVDLGASAAISSIVVWNRTDCCGTRLSDYWVFVSDTPFLATDTPATLLGRAGTFSSHQTSAPNPSTTIAGGPQGRYVRVQLTSANYLSLAEVQVFGQ